jgi:hypothetical protein
MVTSMNFLLLLTFSAAERRGIRRFNRYWPAERSERSLVSPKISERS